MFTGQIFIEFCYVLDTVIGTGEATETNGRDWPLISRNLFLVAVLSINKHESKSDEIKTRGALRVLWEVLGKILSAIILNNNQKPIYE